jgi:hypothetical protein
MHERQRLVREVQADLLESRDGSEARVAQDEGAGSGRHQWIAYRSVARNWKTGSAVA